MTNKLPSQKPLKKKRYPPKPREQMEAYINEQSELIVNFHIGTNKIQWVIEWGFSEYGDNDQ